MKINVAVHIPLFNILSVRQTYCLSIVVAVVLGGNRRLSPRPCSVWDAYDGPASAHACSHGWEQAGPHFAYMLNKKQDVAKHLFINFLFHQVALFMWEPHKWTQAKSVLGSDVQESQIESLLRQKQNLRFE